MRLVGANSSSEGRVEVCYNGSFHSVCDDFWDALNAQVVCRQLGFASSLGKYARAASIITQHCIVRDQYRPLPLPH